MPTDVSAPLPDLDLRDQSLMTVDTGDPNAIITSLVIHVSQQAPDDLLEPSGPFAYTPGPGMGSV
jgi:hypothetical protein